MTDHDPSDRVQLRGRGELQLPGSCILCGSGNCDDGYLDFGIWLEFHGTLYLCMTCMEQAAKVAGCLPAEQTKYLQEANSQLAADLVLAQEQLEKSNGILAQWNSVITTATGSVDATISDLLSPSMGNDEDDEQQPESSAESSGQASEDESVVNESGSIDGPNDVEQSELRDEHQFSL